ncbi:MAG: alpha/beta fold hydrolase [Anaerolineae bacterium]
MDKSGKCLLAVAAAFAGMIYVNRRVANAYRPIYSELDGQPNIYSWGDGVIYYHSKGQGQPIVMLHDFGIVANSYQMKPTYDRLAESYRVYAPDWLGYGLSTRPAVEHTAEAYVQLLSDFLAEVIKEPAVVIAAGPAAAYAVCLAHREPDKVSHLVLLYPTGVERMVGPASKWQKAARNLFRLPVIGTFVFNLLASKAALRWDLRNRVFFDAKLVTMEMVEYAWANAHQPGAKWGPVSCWTGLLNLAIADDLSALQQPTMIVWGQQARKAPVEEIQGFKRYRPDVRYRAFDRCGQWPQYEAAHAFSALVHNWLQGKDKGAAAIFPGEVEPDDC